MLKVSNAGTRRLDLRRHSLLCLLVMSVGLGHAADLDRAGIVQALSRADAALNDRMPDLAERQLQPLMQKDVRNALEAEQAGQLVLLMARALYEQQKQAEIIRLFCSEDEWVAALDRQVPLSFWCALAHYDLDETETALGELVGFEERYGLSSYVPLAIRLRALCRIRQGMYEDAFADMATFVERFPEHPELEICLLDWGKSLVALERYSEAANVLRRLVARPGRSGAIAEGGFWLGCALDKDGDKARAAAMFATVGDNTNAPADLRARAWLACAPLSVTATNSAAAIDAMLKAAQQAQDEELKKEIGFALGRLLLDSGQVDEGVERLGKLIGAAPQDPRAEGAQLALSTALLEDGKHEQAAREFQKYLETYTASSGQAEACRGRGWSLFYAGRYAEAAGAFEKAYGLYLDPAGKEQCLFKEGDAYLANGQFQQAVEAYQRLLDDHPGSSLSVNALFQLGVCRSGLNELAEAEALFQRVIAEFPDNALSEEAMLRLAQLKERMDQWLEAVVNYDGLMTAYPNGTLFAQALQGRGLVRYRLYRFAEALADFEKVVAEFADRPEAEQAFFMRGMCYFGLWRDEEALTICRDFLQRYPDSRWAPEVLFWLSKFAYNQGDYKASEEGFLAFVEKYPAHDLADDCLLRAGLALAKRNEYRQSVEILNRMFKEYPDSPRIVEGRLGQAEALCELAKYSAAILIYDEIIGKYPDSHLLAQAWGRKGDCQFTLGAEDSKRYNESIESYKMVARSPLSGGDLVLQAECKIGRCLEKVGRPSEAFEQYYLNVILRFFQDRENGISHNEAAKVWFTRAALDAADIMERSEDWRRAVSILERVVRSGVPAASEAAERIRKLKAEHWWLFY